MRVDRQKPHDGCAVQSLHRSIAAQNGVSGGGDSAEQLIVVTFVSSRVQESIAVGADEI